MWPQAEYAIIMLDNDPVGRLIVNRVGEHYRLVDITVSPKHRGAGIGTRIVLALCMEAEMQQKSVRLYVSVTNPRAAQLYRRLGFREIEKDEAGCVMERSPGAVSQVIAAE
jgi:ribosomal protein S18 acetylase RimI-like enzyme